MAKIEIEKDVPVPSGRTMNNEKYPFSSMEVNDSFLVPLEGSYVEKVRSKILMASNNYKKKHNKPELKFSTKCFENGVRIWRIA